MFLKPSPSPEEKNSFDGNWELIVWRRIESAFGKESIGERCILLGCTPQIKIHQKEELKKTLRGVMEETLKS